MSKYLTRLISLILSFSLILEQSLFAQAVDFSHYLANSAKAVIQDSKFRPLHLRYLGYDNLSNDFKIILDKGDTRKEDLENKAYLEENTQTLLKYFFIGIALPNDKFWVNLRPDSPDDILDPLLEKTDIGKVFLEADVQLKNDTSGLTSPQTKEGKDYWDKLYKKAQELFGSENTTIPTLTRPWIVPDEVILRESPEGAYIYKATLKVMLEEDYLIQSTSLHPRGVKEVYRFSDSRLKELNQYSTQLIRETIIPKLTQAVNTSKRYAQLRQVYYSLILAQWFKQKYTGRFPNGRDGSSKETGRFLNSGNPKEEPSRQENFPSTEKTVLDIISLIDSGNLTSNHRHLTSQSPYSKETYFQQYQQSFKDGEYNLQEPRHTPYGQSIRRYMSGGIEVSSSAVEIIPGKDFPIKGDYLIEFGPGFSSEVEVSDIDRLGREKLLKVSREIREIGERILKRLFQEYPDIEDEFAWLKNKEIASEDIYMVIHSIRKKHEVDMSLAVAELKEELSNKHNEFWMLLKAVNESPEAIRLMAAERTRVKIELKKIISALGTQASTVNIYVDYRPGGGVMGTARLVAEALVKVSENIKVNIFVLGSVVEPDGINFINGSKDNGAIRLIPIANSRLLSKTGPYYDKVEEAKAHISIEADTGFLGREHALFQIKSLPREQGYSFPSETFYGQKVNNDLTSLYGALPLSEWLKERHENKNNGLTAEDITVGRRLWLYAILKQKTALDLLEKFSSEEGWALEKAIWTSGYYQDRDNFLKEINILCQAFKSEDILSRIPFITGGKQLVMHLVPGKWSGENPEKWGRADRKAIAADLLRQGIAVIDASGKMKYEKPVSRIPVTVVLYETIDNQELKTLLSELNGTLQRDRENKYWIEFPVFITGNASWLEAVSCGLPFLHDNFQTKPSLYKGILVSTLIRMLALEDDDSPSQRSWEELKAEAEKLADEFIMGGNNDPTKYGRLQEWTEKAEKYSQAMLKFNMADDVVMEIVQPSRKPVNEGPITEKTSYEERKEIIKRWYDVRKKIEIIYRERGKEYSEQGIIIDIVYSKDKNGNEIMRIDLSVGHSIDVNNIIEVRELRVDGTSEQLKLFLKETTSSGIKSRDSLPASPTEKNNDLGGIDMRTLPVAVSSASSLPLPTSASSPITQDVNFIEECRQIDEMLNNDFIPATARVRDIAYAASRAALPPNNERVEAVINHIARILRKQEQKFIPTEPALKQILIQIESDKPANEIQLALANITVSPKDVP